MTEALEHICSRHTARQSRPEGFKGGRVPDYCKTCLGVDYDCNYYLQESALREKKTEAKE